MNIEPTLRRTFAAAAVVITLSAGGDGSYAATPAPAAAYDFNSTASLKTTNTVFYADRDYGLARASFQGLVDQCNGFRRQYYQLGAVSPSEATLASVDVSVHEKYIDGNKALTLVTSKGLVLTDERRWQDQLTAAAAAGAIPPAPPDCSVAGVVETRNGTLWRDGLVYDLRYDTRKAIGRRAVAVPLAYMSAAEFATVAAAHVAGQSCRELAGVTGLSPASHACIWDIFPYVRYLNWPFALSGRVQFGLTPTLFETILTQSADHGGAIPPATFDIPAGFTVTVLN